MPDKKKIVVHTFTGGANSDIADQFLKADFFRKMLNMRVYGRGTKGVPTKILGNTLIPNILPDGNNKGHGWAKNEETGKLYLINYNDQGYHGIYAYDILTGSITPVLLNLTDTNGVDIMKLHPDFPVYHFDIVSNNLAYWVDGNVKARKTNLKKCIDKSATGYGTVITEDFITAYKQCGVYAPTVVYFTDLTRSSNYLYGLQFKFTYRWYYDDGEVSNATDFSAVALPPNESYLGADAITFNNNGINVTVETGSKLVTKIEILVKINDNPFVSCIVLNKAERNINSYSTYTFAFYNDGAYVAIEALKIDRPYSFLPNRPYAQAFVKTALLYANFYEGFAPVPILASVDVTYKPFYLPSGTVSELNHPQFIKNQLDVSEHGGGFLSGDSWWTTVTQFVVGSDVKKGNKFSIIYFGGNGPGELLTIVATVADTASTIASKIKQYLRLIDAVGVGTISAEATVSGNVSWNFTVESHEGRPPITFVTSVTPVNYSTLLDNGLSINTIKQGSSRKYGVVYEDDDGRTSLTYTADSLSVKTLFETETVLGQSQPLGLQQPIHTISLMNKPPLWAKYWRLVRTKDIESFIQLLVQQVSTVVVANEDTYLDMVVGSLFTYQKVHPDTILQYEFKRGDRLRLISDENATPPTIYTPYFETEVLSYSPEVKTEIAANISTSIGTISDLVAPSDGPKSDYIGKVISIMDVERTIVGIDGANYVLDKPLTLQNSSDPQIYIVPNYTIIDRRGIVRIKKPTGYTIVNQSLIEIYSPQQNVDNESYLNFLDFQQKFPISDWGTVNAAHVGNIQNQDPSDPVNTPAIVQVTQGECNVINRANPTKNDDPNPQVLVDQICDPNFSDFYKSNLYSTGRVYPQDQAYGEVYFGSRVRFSNNYIEDTRINGLNDFDNTDREDYYDPYGNIMLLRFKRQYLRLFKQLKTAWTPVLQRIVKDNTGAGLLTTSDKLLNDLEYAVWEGGIGNNPESYCENGNSEYIVSVDSGVMIRIAQDGSIPISKVYQLDKDIRDLLADVSKYKLKIPSGFDKSNDDAIWSVDDYIKYLYNNNFNAGDWQTLIDPYPEGTTWAITQQPANSTATVVDGQIQITNTSVLGGDLLKFRGTMPGGGLTPVINLCFTIVEDPSKQFAYAVDEDSDYCFKTEFNNNNGQQGWKVLNGYVVSDNSSNGLKMPNVYLISSEAIVPLSAQITFNDHSSPAPTGGSNGDVWYNAPVDALYKKVGGVWSILTDRVINEFYSPTIENAEACPVTVYYNVEKSGNATRNNCPEGQTGSSVTYTVSAATYTSVISQEDADQKAQDDVNANKQAFANSHGTCTVPPVYENVRKAGVFTRDNCSPGYDGTPIEYVVAEGTYTSSISQEDADLQAQNDVDANGQAYANTNGSCFVESTLGSILIDYFGGDFDADFCFYVKTPGLDETNIIVAATGNGGPLLRPNDGTDPAACYLLSSDRLAPGPPQRRFGVNLAYFIQKYTGTLTEIEFEMRGRSSSAQTKGGSYVLRDITMGQWILTDYDTGMKIPAIPTGSTTGIVSYSTHVSGGGDGSVGVTVGDPVLTLKYDFTTNVLTSTTY